MACRVYLDNEEVNFEGEPPQQVQDALFFLEDFLGQQQKQLVHVFLDGKVLSFSDFETSCDSFEAIKCESQTIQHAKISELLEKFKQNITHAPQILTSDTEQILQFAQNFVQELLNVLSVLKKEHYLLSVIHEPLYLQWIQAFTQSLEDRDFGLTYDAITTLIPIVEETQKQCL